ncbi:ER membrane protein complex subunit 2 isoform X3 [Lingula anatina]|uniref:ER membrane protein complex subunit 2 n=1 Tax=Lingula anatina TaxID=7574 RepID=A0A1S3K6T9_LINAN|nr:ER membrane protein complex subunit 2 isoform X3 [Lingula anatina]|eukprot:XP_013418355.1 ER membrane protein complex subunit 2 isoform X3 [Lingula anatina]
MAYSMSVAEAKAFLRKVREDQIRCSKKIVDIWEEVLVKNSFSLGEEVWLVYEQVCLAALDCAQLDIAEGCYQALKAQFPNSLRVKKLEGMILEAEEEYDRAMAIYEDILEKDETNAIATKRIIAILKAQNKIQDAVEKLNKYLKEHSLDTEAWLELCDMYLHELDYNKAAFCIEECILSNPHNHLYHQKLGEIKYSQCEYQEARSYFAHAAKLNPNNMRALFGLHLSATNLVSSQKGTQKTENARHAAWAAKQIKDRYKTQLGKNRSGDVKIVEDMLEALKMSSS